MGIVKKLIMIILTEPWRPFRYVLQKIYLQSLRLRSNIDVLGRLRIVGLPLIDIHKGGRLSLGDNIRLYSINKDYFLNLYGPVKLVVDHENAIIKIGANSRIYGSCIHCSERIEIGEKVLIAGNCQIMDGSGHDPSFDNLEARLTTGGATKPVVIEDYVWIGEGSKILPGVTIGRGSIIGAGSVVTKSIPPMVIAAGNPARVVKKADGSAK